MPARNRFATLNADTRIWAIAAIHGDVDRLQQVHGEIARAYRAGDGIIYLGNFLGRGPRVMDTIQEMLLFRREVLAVPGGDPDTVVFLRGAQEEMWQKLLTLQFAPNPREVLEWMLSQGVGDTIAAYGSNADEARMVVRDGVRGVTQWTSRLREKVRSNDGHNKLMSSLRRAAYREDKELLFVSAGIDPHRPLSEQTDSFWWGDAGFNSLEQPFGGFARIVRGHDPRQQGPTVNPLSVTVDGGCGFGGRLRCLCFNADGEIVETIEA